MSDVTVSELLRAGILSSGPMPFASFMGMALYHPECGYYARVPVRTGRAGDFYTSVSVGPVFGELMAGQFCEVWEQLGRPQEFTILERGAGDGAFARDVLTCARQTRPDFFAALRYRIDEPLPVPAAAQRQSLAEFADRFTGDAGGPFTGVFFANELLDAVPFRRVRRMEGEWRELLVGLDESGAFREVPGELRDYAALRRLQGLGDDFPDGYTTEVAPAVGTEVWLAGSALERGAAFFFDYGFSGEDYYHPGRTAGTLRCYRAHRAHEDPFDAPGDTDITAHVDFTLAARAAARGGCDVLAFIEQGRFLTGAAEPVLRRMDGRHPDSEAARWLRQFRTLTHPEQMGRSFHALVLGKGLPDGFRLSGLTHARPADVSRLLDPAPPLPAS